MMLFVLCSSAQLLILLEKLNLFKAEQWLKPARICEWCDTVLLNKSQKCKLSQWSRSILPLRSFKENGLCSFRQHFICVKTA